MLKSFLYIKVNEIIDYICTHIWHDRRIKLEILRWLLKECLYE